MVTRENIIEVLKTVYDPEIYIDLWTLGLIYDIEISEGASGSGESSVEGAENPQPNKASVLIRMTFTSIACPVGPALAEEVRSKVASISGVASVKVEVVFTPPWEPSEELKALLGLS